MQQITIRDIEASDIPGLHNLIRNTWDWESLSEDENVLQALVGMYLNEVLHEGTFGKVAVLNDKVAGVVFGVVEGEEHIFRGLQENSMDFVLTLLNTSEYERKTIYDYFTKLNTAYEDLLRDTHYDGTLDFLITAQEAQGLGLGKKLWLESVKYFNSHNVRSIYVYTDTECNFGFYEHLGFSKVREKKVAFVFEDEVFISDILLYDYVTG